MNYIIVALHVGAILFFIVVGSLTVASKKLKLWERFVAFFCTLFINTYYIVSLALYLAGLKK